MRTIKITKELKICLTVPRAIELKKEGLFDVFDVTNLVTQYQKIITDHELFARVLWTMIDQTNITFESFLEFLESADYDHLWSSMTKAVDDFFPSSLRPLTRAVAVSVTDERNAAANRMLNYLKENGTQNDNETSLGVGMDYGSLAESWESILGRSQPATANSTQWRQADSVPSGIEQAG